MTHVCPKCGAKIVVETDDRKHAEKRIEKCEKSAQVQGGKGDGGTEMTPENLERHIM